MFALAHFWLAVGDGAGGGGAQMGGGECRATMRLNTLIYEGLLFSTRMRSPKINIRLAAISIFTPTDYRVVAVDVAAKKKCANGALFK